MVVFRVKASIAYRLPGPDDGGMGPRHCAAESFATGWSILGHPTISSPSIKDTSTMIARDGGSNFNQ
jgi:hypothetical protein